MKQSTIQHPALLGQPRAWEREVARLGAAARQEGLFDVARVEADGLDGNTLAEQEAVRAFVLLGQAFGLDDDALAEWHRVFAFGEVPQPDGALVLCHASVLGDLLLRVLTLAAYQDRHGNGIGWITVWRRSKPLRLLRQAMSEAADIVREELEGAVDPRVRWVSAASRPLGLRAAFWQCRARLVGALLHPVDVHDEADRTTLFVLGGILRIEIQRAQRRLDWRARVDGHAAITLGEALDDRHWMSDWIGFACPGLPPRVHRLFFRLLQRDGMVGRLLAHAREAVRRHPALPHEAMVLAQSAHALVGVYDLPASCYTGAWRNPGLYREVSAWAPDLVDILPLVHRTQDLHETLRGLGDLRAWLRGRGLTAAGWRWLARNFLPCAHVLEATQDTEPIQRWLWLANVFGVIGTECATDEPFCLALLQLWAGAGAAGWPLHDMAWLASAGWQVYFEHADEPRQDAFLRHRFIPAWRWVRAAGWSADSNQRRAGWPAVERAWRAAGAPRPHLGSRNVSWPVPTQGLSMGGLSARPIDNLHDLVVEGDEMSNCLADYEDAAVAGTFAVYSVQAPNGTRIANFSFCRDSVDAPWQPHECLGWCNEHVVDDRVDALARLALVLANKAYPGWDD